VSRAGESLLRLAERPAPGPAFLSALRREGAEAFARLELPTVRHEDWRYTSLAPLAALELRAAPAVRLDAAAAGRLGGLPPAPRLVVANGRLDPDLTDLAGLPAGAFAGDLAAALRERPALLEAHLSRTGSFAGSALAAIADACLEDLVLLHLPDGAAASAPVHVVFAAIPGPAPAAAFPRALVVAGRGARATVVETWAGEGGGLVVGRTEFAVAEGAEVELLRVQREAPEAFHLGLLGVSQAARSRFAGRSLALGARLARVEARVLLAGEEAENHLDGLSVASGSQLHDHFVLVDHAVPRGTSRELFKGILDGRSRGVFAGRIVVRPDAQKTDAGQVSSTLLLSDDATVDTRPQLEILADDVKCSHGGTVGQLDEDALFYLRTRGLGRAAARALLTWAFAAEMVERIPAPLRAGVRRLVTARLPGGELLAEAA
jgi:Fe-S cluster assembly protein SufD